MSTKVNFQKNYTIGGDLTVRRMGYGAMRITGQGIWGRQRIARKPSGFYAGR
jgi:hypothetical protein